MCLPHPILVMQTLLRHDVSNFCISQGKHLKINVNNGKEAEGYVGATRMDSLMEYKN